MFHDECICDEEQKYKTAAKLIRRRKLGTESNFIVIREITTIIEELDDIFANACSPFPNVALSEQEMEQIRTTLTM